MASFSAVTTIEELERLYYSRAGMQFLKQDDLIAPFVTKADDPVLRSTSGVFNAIFGAQAWIQLNMEANAFGVLPKTPWGRSGWRTISARAVATPSGGVGEAAAIPDSIKPTFIEVSTNPKTVAHVFEVSEIHEFLGTEGDDDTYATMANLRQYMIKEHKEHLNAMLLTMNGTLASNNFESVDRIVGSNSEIANCNEPNDQTTAYTTGDLDIYGLDRDAAAAWHDAFVSHNSSTNRSLTDNLINSLIRNVINNGSNYQGSVFFTHNDTWAVINQLYETQVRYNILGETQTQPSINGIKAVMPGASFGVPTSTLYNRPVILSKNVIQNSGGVGHLYLLDISNPEGYDYPRLFIKIAKPTQYFEAGITQGNPFAIDKLSNQGMYRTMGEVICTFFAAQGKIRDIQS